MTNTPDIVLQKQSEIIQAKPLIERLKMGFEMTELSRTIILNQIRQERPELNEIELKIELLKTFYRDDFDDATLHKIAEEMRRYFVKKKTEKEKF
jgi:hypothetical protein